MPGHKPQSSEGGDLIAVNAAHLRQVYAQQKRDDPDLNPYNLAQRTGGQLSHMTVRRTLEADTTPTWKTLGCLASALGVGLILEEELLADGVAEHRAPYGHEWRLVAAVRRCAKAREVAILAERFASMTSEEQAALLLMAGFPKAKGG